MFIYMNKLLYILSKLKFAFIIKKAHTQKKKIIDHFKHHHCPMEFSAMMEIF